MAVGVPAPPPATTFEETSGVIDDLYMVFESRDDAAKIAHVRVAAAEMAALCEAKQGDPQGAIRDLTRRVATVERDAAPTEPPEAHERRVAEAEEQKADAEQVVRQYEDQLAALELEKVCARWSGPRRKCGAPSGYFLCARVCHPRTAAHALVCTPCDGAGRLRLFHGTTEALCMLARAHLPRIVTQRRCSR